MASFVRTATKPDPFTTLGIPRSSTKNNVSKAYHKLALQYHPDKAGHEGTAKSQEIQAAYEEIFTRNLCSDSSARVEEGEGSSFDSSDRAIWEGPPIPPNLSEKERFDLMKGRLKRFFEGKRGRRLGGADQDAAYASFELQIQNQLEVLQGLTHTMDTRIGTAVGHALFALKRMWVDNTIGVRSELVGSFQCQTVASAIGVLGLVSHKTMRCAVSHFVELEANWIRATAKSEPQVQNWPGIGGPGSQALNVACTGPSGDEDVEMMDV